MINPLALTGRTVMVTGANSGIGRSTATLLAGLGARVVLVARNRQTLEETAASLPKGDHRVETLDLSRTAEIGAWLGRLAGEMGPLHGLVHSAGIAPIVPIRAITAEHMHDVMRINVDAAVALTAAFSRRQAHAQGASVVLLASVAGLVGAAGRAAYSASKGALIAFARTAAVELAPLGVRVNCVAPAYVRTPMYEQALEALTVEQREAIIAQQPLGLGEPLDVAHAVAFLLADTGRWITGTVLTVDGGYTAR